MSLLDRLRTRVSSSPVACCRRCRAFEDDARRLEAALPGLASLSSGHASVWGDDGLCAVHDRFTSARGSCSAFTPRSLTPSENGNHPPRNAATGPASAVA